MKSNSGDIEKFLDRDEQKDLLRFLTAGSVDDGKSTLIGRLLYDSKLLYEDQLAALQRDSKRVGSVNGEIDYALLLDGLQAEREQGITIDVAYRYFATSRRKFIIADTPGHEQYTRNMVTGASTANLAIILVDARAGIVDQTRRHTFIISLLGIKHVMLAVNKMDLVNYQASVFDKICQQYRDFVTRLRIPDLHFIPISALKGDNVVVKSAAMAWYSGPPLLEILENVYVSSDRNFIDLRYPVQYVQRPNAEFRGFAGTLASGVIRPGDKILALPSGKRSTVKSIFTAAGELPEAFPPQSVTLTLNDEIDISRGDMLVHPDNMPRIGRTIEALLVWMAETPMNREHRYIIKHTTRTARAEIVNLKYRFDINNLRKKTAETLNLNEIGRLTLTTTQPLFFDSYQKNHSSGSFILIDALSNDTVAVGMIIDRPAADDSNLTAAAVDNSDTGVIPKKTAPAAAAATTAGPTTAGPAPTAPTDSEKYQGSALSELVAEQLIQHEGLRLKPYRCPAGKLTIGVGRNLEQRGITEAEARMLLNNDIAAAVSDLRAIFPGTDDGSAFDDLPENVQRVIIDMHFNLGKTGFLSFKKMIKAVKAGDYPAAAREMRNSNWFHQVGKRGENLVKMMLGE